MAKEETAASENPVAKLAELKKKLDERVNVDSPLGEIGWDSVQMTWVLIRLEERYDIDTSNLSIFDMFTVGDLLRSLIPLIEEAKRARG